MTPAPFEIRPGVRRDLAAVEAIQTASPEAAAWPVADYLRYDFRVAVSQDRLAGFLAARAVAEGEYEILNLAVAPEWRRRGVGRALVESLVKRIHGYVFLEVRDSNAMARKFYQSLGFEELTQRPGYYAAPPEAAIVMKFHSC